MGSFRSSLFLAFTALGCFASATFNSTGFEPSFVPEPRGRGTVGVLWSCLITLGLCVWTGIHGDIVFCRGRWDRLIYKLWWMLFALLIPEYVVGYAIIQWWEARKLYREWCDHFQVKAGSKGDHLGMEGAFFVIMGGFVVGSGVKDEESGGKDSLVPLSTLKPKSFIQFTKSGMISKDAVNRRVIMDKGKADTLAKLLVCLQALWMVVQCTARKIQGLPITLLELHVLIQVAFVVAMYGFWWYKPLDVNEPIVVIENPVFELSVGLKCVKKARGVGIVDFFGSVFSHDRNIFISVPFALLTSGAHATAWNYHFPTPIEGLLWRISSIILGGPLLLQVLVSALCSLWDNTFGRSNLSDTTYGIFMLLLYLVYGLGIIFITVESFISIRKVPEGTYESVAWMDFWPHV